VIAAALFCVAAAPAAPPVGETVVPPEDLLVLQTSKGRILVELAPTIAPGHTARARELARSGWWDGAPFYRVLGGYIAQAGQLGPRNDYSSGRGTLKAEFGFPGALVQPADADQGFVGAVPVWRDPGEDGRVAFCPGVVAMARYADPDSADSQFFIVQGKAANLEGQFTAFGVVVDGMDAVRALAVGEPPTAPDRVVSARVAADLPQAERPTVVVPMKRLPKKGVVPVCDVNLPVEVR
jgi:peptidylprolyl isomerase